MTPDPRRAIDPRLTAVIATAFLVAVLASVLLSLRDRPPVVLIGDSITAGADDQLREDLSRDYALTIDGRPGFRVADQLPAAENASRLPFEQVVINLGTNDVMTADQPVDQSADALRDMVALFPATDCIHLVTVSEHIVSFTVDAADRAASLNDAMRALAAEDERVDVIDWSALVGAWQDAHPGEALTTDTVHPNDEGNDLLVEAYAEALNGCQPPR